jgi:hypothetical protein
VTRRGPDNSVRVSISGLGGGNPFANTFFCQLTTSSTPSQADLDGWLTTFQAAYKTRFAPLMASGVTFALARAVLFVPGGSELISQIAMTGAGTGGANTAADGALATVISWASNVYWRGGKPRSYLPLPLAAAALNNYEFTTTHVTNATTAGTSFRTDVNAITSGAITATVFGFVSFFSGKAPRAIPVFYSFIGAKVHQRFGTQRRRLGPALP